MTFTVWSCWDDDFWRFCRVVARTRAEAQRQAAIITHVPATRVRAVEARPVGVQERRALRYAETRA